MSETGYQSVIGKGLSIVGEINSSTSLKVDGHFEGSVTIRTSLNVGSTGLVRGDIVAREVVISGHVVGNIIACSVTLHSTAIVEGDVVSSNVLSIHPGAKIESKIENITEDEFNKRYEVLHESR